jgi:hypothetical protein
MTAPLNGHRAYVDHSAAGAFVSGSRAAFPKAAIVCPPPFRGSTDTQDYLLHKAILVPNANDSDMTASAKRTPNPSSSRRGKNSQLS